MPDFGSPIAQNVNPVGQGLQTLSGLLALKQQQLGLQQTRANIGIAQAGVQTAQAEAQQAQQKNQELAQAQALAQAARNGQYRKPDGSLDTNAFSEAVQGLGPYAQTFSQGIVARANEAIQNKTAINKLNTTEQNQVADTLLSVANKPGVTYSDAVNAVDEMVSNNPQLQRLGISVMGMFHPDMNSQQLSGALKQLSTSMHGAGTAPTLSMIQGPNGLQQVQTNLNAAAPIGPAGKPIKQGIPPQLVTNPLTGGPAVVGPNAGSVQPVGQIPSSAQAPGAQSRGPSWLQGTSGGWQPQPGQTQMIQQDVHAFVGRAQNGISAANTSPVALDSLERISAILNQGTWTGGAFSGFKDLKNLAASMGIDTTSADNASELVKNMARYEAARAGAVGNTDASRALVAEGSPNFKMDAKAVKSVVEQSIANEQIIQSYGNLMESAPNPQIGMQREQQLRSIPHLLQMFELGNMKSASQVDEFLKRYDLSGSELAKSRQMYDQLMRGVTPISKVGG